MAEKDATEKTLLDYADVFADILNGTLFHGRKVIEEKDLSDALPRSIYKADGKMHEQERDVAKFWKKNQLRIAFLGLENQTDVDEDMVLRVIGYDGAAYRAEMNADRKGKPKVRYPIVTVVLYFGYKKHWDKPLHLRECFDIPEELKPYISDYRINLVEVAWLSARQITKFKSDFKLVADFFRQMRLGYEAKRPYRPLPAHVKHVREVLDLLAAVSGDRKLEEITEKWNGREQMTMDTTISTILDEYFEHRKEEIAEEAEKRGMKEGKREGKREGKLEGKMDSIRKLMKNCGWTAKQAMDALSIPKAKQASYEAML